MTISLDDRMETNQEAYSLRPWQVIMWLYPKRVTGLALNMAKHITHIKEVMYLGSLYLSDADIHNLT